MDNPDILVEEETQDARLRRLVKAFVQMNEEILWRERVIGNMIKLSSLTNEEIASIMNVPIEYVKEIRGQLFPEY